MSKIAILIADSDEPFFNRIKHELYEKGWSEFRNNGIDVFYIKGKTTNGWLYRINNRIELMRYTKFWPIQYLTDNLVLFKYRFLKPSISFTNDNLMVDTPEGLKYLSVKILAGLEALIEKKYDYIFRTTLSTVLNYSKFISIISDLSDKDDIYAGYLIDFNDHKFISGSSCLFSKGAVEKLVKSKKQINFGRLDDVAFGRILIPKLVPISLPHLNLTTLEEVEKLSEDDLFGCLSFRCKSSCNPRIDDTIAKSVLLRLIKK